MTIPEMLDIMRKNVYYISYCKHLRVRFDMYFIAEKMLIGGDTPSRGETND